jgi:hypothetical protein
MVWRTEEAGMGVFIAFVVVVAVILLVNKIGDWIDIKTGWVVGFIIAGLVSIYLMTGLRDTYKDSIQPRPAPICKQMRTC